MNWVLVSVKNIVTVDGYMISNVSYTNIQTTCFETSPIPIQQNQTNREASVEININILCFFFNNLTLVNY